MGVAMGMRVTMTMRLRWRHHFVRLVVFRCVMMTHARLPAVRVPVPIITLHPSVRLCIMPVGALGLHCGAPYSRVVISGSIHEVPIGQTDLIRVEDARRLFVVVCDNRAWRPLLAPYKAPHRCAEGKSVCRGIRHMCSQPPCRNGRHQPSRVLRPLPLASVAIARLLAKLFVRLPMLPVAAQGSGRGTTDGWKEQT